jgi:hypothetical protein
MNQKATCQYRRHFEWERMLKMETREVKRRGKIVEKEKQI